MTFTTFETVFFTVAFLVPGFVWSSVVSLLVPRRSRAPQLRMLEFLTPSCLNYGLWSWALFLLFSSDLLRERSYLAAFSLFAIVFVSPIGLGVLSGWLRQRNAIASFLGRFGFHTIHPLPTAWDWKFSRGYPYWFIVTLADGACIYGLFGRNSFAGDEPTGRDLYLEAMYYLDNDGEWYPVEQTGGVWIAATHIAVVEFRKLEEVNYEQ